MVNAGTWVYQGRQQHQWFGHGTAPKDNAAAPHPAADNLFAPEGVERRIDYAAISVIGHLLHKDRARWAASRYDAPPERLRTTVAAWYLADSLSQDQFRERFLDPYTSDETVRRLRLAAHGIVEARSHAKLGLASKDLAEAVKTIGVERWPRYLAGAERRATQAVTDGDVPGVTKASISLVIETGVFVGILIAGAILKQVTEEASKRARVADKPMIVEQAPPNNSNSQSGTANSGGLAKPGDATLSKERRDYILNGNGKGGGGHGKGRNTPDKSEFPPKWTDDEAIDAVKEVANDPTSSRRLQADGRTVVEGTRDGVDIRVIIETDGKSIISAFPTNVKRNPPRKVI